MQPELGPLATAYGEIYRYELKSDGTHDLMELRTLNDWVVVPRLRRMAGVADVINFGGYAKQFTLMLEPIQLERFGLTFDDVVEAIKTNNANAGGSVLRRGEMSFVIRGQGAFQTVGDIESTVINTIGGTPVYVRDVASVGLDSMLPTGIFSKDRVDESVEGIVLLRRGENPSHVLDRVKAEVEELNATVLAQGRPHRAVLRSHFSGRQHAAHRQPQHSHRDLAGRAGAADRAGQPDRGAAGRAHDSVFAAVCPGADVFHRHPDRPAVDRGHRLWHPRRRRGHHGREHRASAQCRRRNLGQATVGETIEAAALEVQRPDLLLDADHHRRLRAAADADQHRRTAVSADGA